MSSNFCCPRCFNRICCCPPVNQGARGPQGPQGPQGSQGLRGIPGASAIIPYASGGPVTLNGVLGGLEDTAGLIGFGSSIAGVSIAGGIINLGAGGVLDFAFVVPRAGTVTSISGFFSSTAGLITTPSPVTVRAELWRSTTPASSTFTPTGAFVNLAPTYAGGVGPGINAIGTAPQGLPVSAGDKLLMVFSIVGSAATSVIDSLTGFASAGVEIR
ncbi:spore surface glycoprotein BclB [Peribacillus simplex]|uniref:exosporium glycoprotein BclB-related protein n=1 Tax=Peribacillus simplex TaxID=1478 RepID=UPI00203A45DE|nr:exosporium glycoprotein BclB-related protein [Peribacillus simplex]MCM3677336.1 spore surface glycoprotein BclB [Peribacillus simplex]